MDIKDFIVPLAELRHTCDPAEFPFTTTDELKPRDEVIGQARRQRPQGEEPKAGQTLQRIRLRLNPTGELHRHVVQLIPALGKRHGGARRA